MSLWLLCFKPCHYEMDNKVFLISNTSCRIQTNMLLVFFKVNDTDKTQAICNLCNATVPHGGTSAKGFNKFSLITGTVHDNCRPSYRQNSTLQKLCSSILCIS